MCAWWGGKTGDERILKQARTSIRSGFLANAALGPGDPETAEAIRHAEAVADLLRHNLVQGKKEGDLYST